VSQAPPEPAREVPASVIYCRDCLEELKRLPDGCIDLVYLDPPFNSNRNYELFWGGIHEEREHRYRGMVKLIAIRLKKAGSA